MSKLPEVVAPTESVPSFRVAVSLFASPDTSFAEP